MCRSNCVYVIWVLADAHRQRTVNWIDGCGGLSCAFDFTTKAILQVHKYIYMSFSQHFQASSQFEPEFFYLPGRQFFDENFQVLLSLFGSEVKKSLSFLVLALSQEAVRKREWWRLRDAQGRPPGVLGMWPSRAVTFVDNHDTGSTQVYTTQHITLSQL